MEEKGLKKFLEEDEQKIEWSWTKNNSKILLI